MISSRLTQLCRIPVMGSSILSNGASILMRATTQQLALPIFTPNVEQVRTKIHKYWKRPSERKRLAKHGWETRLKTPGGRAIIMRRILKGRFVLSH